jgi:hypothetical protein
MKTVARVELYTCFYFLNLNRPKCNQLLDMTNKFLWMVLAAVLTSVAALMNSTIPSPGNYTIDAGPQPLARRAGYDIDTYEDFMEIEPLDDDSWEKLKCKGENLMKAMQASDAEAGKYWNPLLSSAESQWTDFSMFSPAAPLLVHD